jgi:UDP-GlcNAc:undecaprenyl-phosphate GlcNAc-1-phosphate transferase
MGGAGFIPWILVLSLWRLVDSLPHGASSLLRPIEIFRADLIMGSLLGGAGLLFMAGWLDDRLELRPRTKLLFQLAAASQLIYFGGGVNITGWAIFDAGISYFWLIGITNAVNLLDNMDGLCAGVVGIIATAMSLFWSGSVSGAATTAAMAGGCMGFLIHNRPPARIFMGDTGSLPLGFLCAGLSLPGVANACWGWGKASGWMGLGLLLACAILVAVPILDTALVAITRVWSSRDPMQGGQDHSSHRMARLLVSERRSLAFFLILAATSSSVFLWSVSLSPPLMTVIALLFWLAAILVGNFLAHAEGAGLAEPPLILRALGDWLSRYAFFPLCFDGALVLTLLPMAYYLRFDFQLGPEELEATRRSIPILLFCCLGVGLASGSYAIRWKYASKMDYLHQAVSSGVAVLIALAILTFATRFDQGYSRSAYLIFAFLFISVQGLGRRFEELGTAFVGRAAKIPNCRSIVIYGAGKRGRLLAEGCGALPELAGYRAVAFFDDNQLLTGKKIDGLYIFSTGSNFRLPHADEVWIAGPAIDPARAKKALPKEWACLPFRRLILELEKIESRKVKGVESRKSRK